jgi:hypothetical protein
MPPRSKSKAHPPVGVVFRNVEIKGGKPVIERRPRQDQYVASSFIPLGSGEDNREDTNRMAPSSGPSGNQFLDHEYVNLFGDSQEIWEEEPVAGNAEDHGGTTVSLF